MLNQWISHLGLCPIRNITGLPCPGCGMTRAFLSLAKFDLAAALEYHPLFWLIPLIFIVVIFRHRVALFKRLATNKPLIWGIVSLFFLVYGWRMWHFFPQTVPLDFNANGLIPLMIHLLLN